ncbi:MAG: hypothetical protein AB7O45_07540 [Alphaproteobacteria bacterium]
MNVYGKTIAALVAGGAMALIKAGVAIGLPAYYAELGATGWDLVTAGVTAWAVYRWPNAAKPLPGDDGNQSHA